MKKVFGIHKGHKIDGTGHAWLFLQGFISLSYSYMTFVINREMSQKTNFLNDDYIFDAEQYNYMINSRNALTNKDLINNSVKLQYVLQKFYETDSILLD